MRLLNCVITVKFKTPVVSPEVSGEFTRVSIGYCRAERGTVVRRDIRGRVELLHDLYVPHDCKEIAG